MWLSTTGDNSIEKITSLWDLEEVGGELDLKKLKQTTWADLAGALLEDQPQTEERRKWGVVKFTSLWELKKVWKPLKHEETDKPLSILDDLNTPEEKVDFIIKFLEKAKDISVSIEETGSQDSTTTTFEVEFAGHKILLREDTQSNYGKKSFISSLVIDTKEIINNPLSFKGNGLEKLRDIILQKKD